MFTEYYEDFFSFKQFLNKNNDRISRKPHFSLRSVSTVADELKAHDVTDSKAMLPQQKLRIFSCPVVLASVF